LLAPQTSRSPSEQSWPSSPQIGMRGDVSLHEQALPLAPMGAPIEGGGLPARPSQAWPSQAWPSPHTAPEGIQAAQFEAPLGGAPSSVQQAGAWQRPRDPSSSSEMIPHSMPSWFRAPRPPPNPPAPKGLSKRKGQGARRRAQLAAAASLWASL
jgi:hypothetical protein